MAGGTSSLSFDGKWHTYGDLHLKLEYWSIEKHSQLEFIKGYGGCIANRSLPLNRWNHASFEAIGKNLGGLVSI